MNYDADSRPQLRLHAYHPRLDVLVVGVDGELDLLLPRSCTPAWCAPGGIISCSICPGSRSLTPVGCAC